MINNFPELKKDMSLDSKVSYSAKKKFKKKVLTPRHIMLKLRKWLNIKKNF